MSVNVRLTQDIRESSLFQPSVEKGLKKASFDGIDIFERDGTLFFGMSSLDGEIPEKLEEFLAGKVTLRENFPMATAYRVQGIYRLGQVSATLESTVIGGTDYYELEVTGAVDTRKEMQDLYYKIRAGTIAPVESWEASQCATPEEQLERQLISAMQQINAKDLRLSQLSESFRLYRVTTITALEKLRSEYDGRWLASAARVVRKTEGLADRLEKIEV